MTDREQNRATTFGGSWTIEKLDILESYLDAYTTMLKNQPFKLMYIDAFAGTGRIEFSGDADDDDVRNFVSGSAERAVKIDNKPFDKLLFVEKEPDRCAKLEKFLATHPERNVVIENSEANEFLYGLDEDWLRWRGVLFLDPFATEVEWRTIEKIAGFKALDAWMLFPVSAIMRMLPKSKRPDDITGGWVTRLTKVFGDESWRELYRESPQQPLFGGVEHERTTGVDGLLEIYKKKLTKLFGDRFLKKSRTLKNSRNSPLFEFVFCVGNSKGLDPAKRIAKHILEHL